MIVRLFFVPPMIVRLFCAPMIVRLFCAPMFIRLFAYLSPMIIRLFAFFFVPNDYSPFSPSPVLP